MLAMNQSTRIAAVTLLALALVHTRAGAQTPAPVVAPPAPAPAAPASPTPAPAEPMLPPTPSPEAATDDVPELATIETSPEEAELPAKVGYEKGFFIESGDGNNRLVIGGRIQFRYTYLGVESGPDSNAFSVERARIKLEGHVITPDLTYLIQPELGRGALALRDFYGDYRVAPDLLHVRVGQFYRPFSRQQLTSDGSQELVDRAITDREFDGGRDIGLMLHNNYEKSPELEYALGLFNGTGDAATTTVSGTADATTGELDATSTSTNVPRNLHPALVARVGYNHGGLKGYSEVDLEGGDLRFGVAASGQIDFDTDRDDDSLVKAELDAMLKAHGFSTSGAVYVSSVQTAADFGDRGLGAIGFHLQAGYLIVGKYQVAARFALLEREGDNNNDSEIAGVLGYFHAGHNLKWQTDLAALTHEASDTTDLRLRSQMQFAF
jgi:hypothetical protein